MDWILRTTRTYWGGKFYLDEEKDGEKLVKNAANLFLDSARKARHPETHISEYEIFLAGVNYQRSLEQNKAAKNGN